MKQDYYKKEGRIFYNNYDPKTGRWLPLAKGERPPKMKEMENKLCLKFEDDYKKQYLSGKMGQLRFAKRWGTTKGMIFGHGPAAKRNCWIIQLKLKKRNTNNSPKNNSKNKKVICEICGIDNVTLDKAHWIDNAKGGPRHQWNILNLCPNCHRKVDIDRDSKTINAMEKAILSKAVKFLYEKENQKKNYRDKLLKICKAIINRKI